MCMLKKTRGYKCTHPKCPAWIPPKIEHVRCREVIEAEKGWCGCLNPAYETVITDVPRAERAKSHMHCEACLKRRSEIAPKVNEWVDRVEGELADDPTRQVLKGKMVRRDVPEDDDEEVKFIKVEVKKEDKA